VAIWYPKTRFEVRKTSFLFYVWVNRFGSMFFYLISCRIEKQSSSKLAAWSLLSLKLNRWECRVVGLALDISNLSNTFLKYVSWDRNKYLFLSLLISMGFLRLEVVTHSAHTLGWAYKAANNQLENGKMCFSSLYVMGKFEFWSNEKNSFCFTIVISNSFHIIPSFEYITQKYWRGQNLLTRSLSHV
jgi:hypothetical protein